MGCAARADEHQRHRPVSNSDDYHAAVRRRETLRHNRAVGYLTDSRPGNYPRQMVGGVRFVRRDLGAFGAEPGVAVYVWNPGLAAAHRRLSWPALARRMSV